MCIPFKLPVALVCNTSVTGASYTQDNIQYIYIYICMYFVLCSLIHTLAYIFTVTYLVSTARSTKLLVQTKLIIHGLFSQFIPWKIWEFDKIKLLIHAANFHSISQKNLLSVNWNGEKPLIQGARICHVLKNQLNLKIIYLR